MKRSGFKRQQLPRRERTDTFEAFEPKPRAIACASADLSALIVTTIPKQEPLQHQGYMALVRRMHCARCGHFRIGEIQFCHSDESKGLALKSDCRLGWPGCGARPGIPGCHWYVGTSGQMTREERREFESTAAKLTRLDIINKGLWPRDLPRWGDE